MTNQIVSNLQVGLVIDEEAATYIVHLINPTDQIYSAIRVLTGAFQGDEDGLIETSRKIRDLGPLKPYSTIVLEDGDIDNLEFVVWYHLDLWTAKRTSPILLQFSLPKYHWLSQESYKNKLKILPVINQQGYQVELINREDGFTIETEHIASLPTDHWGLKTIYFTPRVEAALAKAKQLHQGQTRKSLDIPYISHPINVATIVAGYTIDEDVIIAAYLHDTLEDCDYTLEQLHQEFGSRVADLVAEVTENITLKKRLGGKATWQERKQQYLEHLKNASQDALLIAAADKIDNLNSMLSAYKLNGDAVWADFNAPPEKQQWFYEEFIRVVKAQLDSFIIEELEQTYRKAKPILIKR